MVLDDKHFVRMPEYLPRALKVHAAKNSKTIKSMLVEIVSDYLEKKKKTGK